MMTLNFEESEKLLDSVGWAILVELQEDARISFSELGRRVGLSSPAVAERVRRMEEAGIITGYHAQVNLEAVGRPMMAIMSLRTEGNSGSRVISAVQTMPEVMVCHTVTGVECFYLRVAVCSVEHLRLFIERLKIYGHVTTSLILQSPVQRRTLCPPEEF